MWLFVPEFQSTLPSQGATLYDCYDTYAKIFQSTLPSQGATKIQPCRERMCKFQSTLPSQGATSYNHVRLFNSRISIHAPLTGSDANALVEQIMEQNFNPRSPHRERPLIKSRTPYSDLFQSTLPSQGATFNSAILKAKRTFQSTLPSQGATAGNGQAISRAGISIHAPLTGSDAMVLHDEFDFGISIHAPLTGSDPDNFDNSSPDNGISIHAPLTGSDLPAFGQSFCKCRFQSTLPSQGAT